MGLRILRSMKHFLGFNSKKNIQQQLNSTNTGQEMAATKTIHDFGYSFNAEGKLRKLDEAGQPGDITFQFNVSDNHQECQKHYEALGDAITDYIYTLLEEQEKLIKLPVPEGSKKGTFVFVSKDYDKKENLIVLIHGTGVVRAGQWARSLLINDSINSGSQIPYIRNAVTRDFGVLIMNTNDNYTSDNKEIPNSSSPEEHATYVWDSYISKAKAESIVIVAHSYGGVVTLDLAEKVKNFEDRVKAVALTDSVHGFSNLKVSKSLRKIARNWVSSVEPLDVPIKTPDHDIVRVSAGHPKHEMTSHSCIESVFKFIDEKLHKK